MQITENLTPYNHDSGRAGRSVTGIVLHTMVGYLQPSINSFFNPNRGVSSNYCVGLGGEVVRVVRESDTAWCNGNYQSNLSTISIEHEDGGDYDGPRTSALYQASSELVADICNRYGIDCNRDNIKGHNEVIDKNHYPHGTACPDALDLDRIIAGANSILNPSQASVNEPTPSATGETVFLPADNDSWRLYPTDQLPVVGNEKATLAPSQYGGLTYAVLGHPYPNVVTIATQMFGIGNIWVGSDTNAQVSSAPVPAPVAPTVEPATPEKSPAIAICTYSRLEAPLSLIANKQPTKVYNLDPASWGALDASVVKELKQGDPFPAVGKAKHPLGGVYYMTAYSFGNADTTGKPDHNFGINTVDLAPAPTEPVTPTETPATNDDNKVPVTVIPSDPNKWKTDIDKSYAGVYKAISSLHVKSLTGPDEQQLVEGQPVKVAGMITKAGVKSFVTQKSIDSGKYYAIPPISVTEQSLDEDNEMLDIANEAKEFLANLNNREQSIKVAGYLNGIFKKFFHKK